MTKQIIREYAIDFPYKSNVLTIITYTETYEIKRRFWHLGLFLYSFEQSFSSIASLNFIIWYIFNLQCGTIFLAAYYYFFFVLFSQ